MESSGNGEALAQAPREVDRRAREEALEAAAGVPVEPTSLVAFNSRGRVLIIGAAPQATQLAAELRGSGLSLCILTPDGGPAKVEDAGVQCVCAGGRAVRIEGHFGEFSVIVEGQGGDIDIARSIDRDNAHFDLIVDFQVPPRLDVAVPPLGYYPAGVRAAVRERLVRELPEMVGEFEKARYFSYDPSICAHGNSGLQACRRCLDACPTGAITSLVDKIEVDPYWCQGGGICATACPTGAIVYSYPRPKDLLNRLRTLLRVYRQRGGTRPALLFHAGAGPPAAPEAMPGNVIAIELEEIGSAGIEVWLAALAFGAERVGLCGDSDLPAAVIRELDAQLEIAGALLGGLGYPGAVLARLDLGDAERVTGWLDAGAAMPPIQAATFAGSNYKRDTLFYALDHLIAQCASAAETIPLPAAAPLGAVSVDRDACTLCMACVSVCPAGALSDGVDQPLLGFIERNCVQCGLCEAACPEDAITRAPRLLVDREQALHSRALNREQPFCCIGCGKPFANRSVIDKIKGKLAAHPMFKGESALRRLEMCEDCRVRDMFADQE